MSSLYNKRLILGAFFTGIITVSGTALSMNQTVSALLDNTIKFQFNQNEKSLPSEYSPLIYNDRTYVPARFIAEELGAKVEWNEKFRTINITNENPPSTPTEQEKEEVPQTESPKTLPLSKVTDDGVLVTIRSIDRKSSITYLSFKIMNTKDTPVSLEQGESYLVADKKKLLVTSFESATESSRIEEDQSYEGVLKFPRLPKDSKNIKVFIQVHDVEGFKRSASTLEFHVNLDEISK